MPEVSPHCKKKSRVRLASLLGMKFNLRFPSNEIQYLAGRYVQENKVQVEEDEILDATAPSLKGKGFYTKEQFLKVCYWKTHRSRRLCEKNDEALIREATQIALNAQSEELRIGVLNSLRGVYWPTASVLLHFGHAERYPILDVRALWSLSIPVPSDYSHEFWSDYVKICRQLSDESCVDMRTVDRALWQFSSEKQGPLQAS